MEYFSDRMTGHDGPPNEQGYPPKGADGARIIRPSLPVYGVDPSHLTATWVPNRGRSSETWPEVYLDQTSPRDWLHIAAVRTVELACTNWSRTAHYIS